MIPKDVLKKIRRIEIITSRMVNDMFAGQYQSVFKGSGMEFNEVREYQPGDEIRSIDWNVTARMGHPFIKKFVEERELTVMILLDASMSCRFGSTKQLKSQVAAELCSILAFSAIKNNDKVGLVVFADKIEKFIPPRKGLRHVLKVIREALYFRPKGKGTNITNALEYLSKVAKRKTITFIISDFFDKGFKQRLSIANKKHDIVAIAITDPREINLPNIGLIRLADAETGKNFIVDTSDEAFRKHFNCNALSRMDERKKMLRSINVDSIEINTGLAYSKELIKFFKMREKRLR